MKKDFFSLEIIKEFRDNIIDLVEPRNQRAPPIKLVGIPSNAIIITLDHAAKGFYKKTAYLRPRQKFVHKGCDYVIIIPDQQVVVLIELKYSSQGTKAATEQLQISEIFMNYVFNLSAAIDGTFHQYKILKIYFSRNNISTLDGSFHAVEQDGIAGQKIKILRHIYDVGTSIHFAKIQRVLESEKILLKRDIEYWKYKSLPLLD